MQIIDKILNEIEVKGISVLKLSKETGIPAYRIYKWRDKKGNTKHEDVMKLEKWLNKIDEVPRETLQLNEDAAEYFTKDDYIKSLQATVEAQKKTIEYLETRIKEGWVPPKNHNIKAREKEKNLNRE